MHKLVATHIELQKVVNELAADVLYRMKLRYIGE
jgi:hypothetical protein